MSIAAVVLAAGEASRFGTPKQRLLLPEVLERLTKSSVKEIVVVAGAHTLETPATVVTCAGWKRGPGASLTAGLEELSARAEAAVVVLADGPDLAPEAVDRIIASWRADGGTLVAASYGGERGHPLLVAREEWGSIPDAGLRDLDVRLVPCDDLGSPGDVDTPADLPERLAVKERKARQAEPSSLRGEASASPPGCSTRSAAPQLRQLLHQPDRHPLHGRRLHVHPQRLLEPVPTAAVVTAVEMGLCLRDLDIGELPVEVSLQQLLARIARRVAHEIVSWASSCFSSRRPRWSRDITVPIGMSRIWAASA